MAARVTRQTVEVVGRRLNPDSDAFVGRQTLEVVSRNERVSDARVSRQTVEIVVSAMPGLAAVSRQTVEVVSSRPSSAQVGRQTVEVVSARPAPPGPPDDDEAQVTRQTVEVVTKIDSLAAVTRQTVEVVTKLASSMARVNRQTVEVVTAHGDRLALVGRQTVELVIANVPSDVQVGRQTVEVVAQRMIPPPPPVRRRAIVPARCDLGDAEWSWSVRTLDQQLVANPSSKAWVGEADRRLNETGRAQLVVESGCCDTLDAVESGDTLLLYRNGRLAWLGTIIEPVTSAPNGDRMLNARDWSWWLIGRFFALPTPVWHRDVGLSLRDLLALSAAADPRVALTWNAPVGDLLGADLALEPSLTTNFYSVLETMADAVLDWTVIGNEIMVGRDGTGAGDLPRLTGESWTDGQFVTAQSHVDYADRVFVGGKNDLVGYYPPDQPAPSPRWGAKTVYIGDATLADLASCITRARTEFFLRNPPPRRLTVPTGALVDKNIRFDQLIPGAATKVETPLTCGDGTVIDMLLATMKVTFSAGSEDKVTIATVETGADDGAA